MKLMKLIPFLLITVLLILTTPVRAQEGDCDLDMTQVEALAQEAQDQANDGNVAGALRTITDMRAAVREIVTNCGGTAAAGFSQFVGGGATTDSTSTTIDTGDITLTQSISSEDFDGNTLSLFYPDGWVAVERSGEIYLANSQAALDTVQGTTPLFEEGDIAGAIFFGPTDVLGLGTNPADIISLLVDSLASSLVGTEAELEFSQPEIATFGDNEGAIASGNAFAGDEVGLGMVVVTIQEGDGLALMIFLTALDGFDTFDAEIRAIAATVEYEAN